MKWIEVYDHIAPMYDRVRGAPPSNEQLQAVIGELTGCHTILDAGVGTGRFAVPLQAHGFEVVGVDFSIGMLLQARTKGIGRLVRGDISHLPFRDQAIDAVFVTHVLHHVPDLLPVFREFGRVARRAVMMMFQDAPDPCVAGLWKSLYKRYRDLAAEKGYALKPVERYEHSLEEISAIVHPRTLRVVPGVPPVGLTFENRLDLFYTGQIPLQMHTEITHQLKEEDTVDSSEWAHPQNTQIGIWDPRTLLASAQTPS